MQQWEALELVLKSVEKRCGKNSRGAKDEAIVIAIDGRAAAGKSTFAKALSQALECQVIHMDYFFLPMNLRTEERLREIGGNVHYERFQEEVLGKIRENETFDYRRFSCRSMNYVMPERIEKSRVYIVEGAYSMHPKFGEYWDLGIFIDIDGKKQLNRIEARNGKELRKVFKEKWIPLENQYFDQYQIRNKCDLVLEIEENNEN